MRMGFWQVGIWASLMDISVKEVACLLLVLRGWYSCRVALKLGVGRRIFIWGIADPKGIDCC